MERLARPLQADCGSVSHYAWMYSTHWSGHGATLKPHPRPHQTTPETRRWHFLCPLTSLSLEGSAFWDFRRMRWTLIVGWLGNVRLKNQIHSCSFCLRPFYFYFILFSASRTTPEFDFSHTEIISVRYTATSHSFSRHSQWATFLCPLSRWSSITERWL